MACMGLQPLLHAQTRTFPHFHRARCEGVANHSATGECVWGCVCEHCERALAVVRVRLGGCMPTCGSMRWGCWSRCPARGFQLCLPCLAPRLHLGTACCTAGSGPGPPAVQTIILHSSTCPSTAARAVASCSPCNVMLSKRVLESWKLVTLHPG